MELNDKNFDTEFKRLVKEYDIKLEYIAYKLGYSYPAVQGWYIGRRVPKQPVIEKITHIINGVKSARERKEKQ